MTASIQHHPAACGHDRTHLDHLVKRLMAIGQLHYDVPMDPGADGENALQIILQEIDETVLPRRLTVACPPAADITLIVSNRRLLTMTAGDQTHHPADATPEDVAQTYASVLRSLCASAHTFVLRTPQPSGDQTGSDLSVSATLLRKALGISASYDAGDPQDADLLGTLRTAATSWIEAKADMTVLAKGGPHDQVAGLRSFWQSYASSLAGQTPKNRLQTRSKQLFFLPLNAENGLALLTYDRESWLVARIEMTQFQNLCGA